MELHLYYDKTVYIKHLSGKEDDLPGIKHDNLVVRDVNGLVPFTYMQARNKPIEGDPIKLLDNGMEGYLVSSYPLRMVTKEGQLVELTCVDKGFSYGCTYYDHEKVSIVHDGGRSARASWVEDKPGWKPVYMINVNAGDYTCDLGARIPPHDIIKAGADVVLHQGNYGSDHGTYNLGMVNVLTETSMHYLTTTKGQVDYTYSHDINRNLLSAEVSLKDRFREIDETEAEVHVSYDGGEAFLVKNNKEEISFKVNVTDIKVNTEISCMTEKNGSMYDKIDINVTQYAQPPVQVEIKMIYYVPEDLDYKRSTCNAVYRNNTATWWVTTKAAVASSTCSIHYQSESIKIVKESNKKEEPMKKDAEESKPKKKKNTASNKDNEVSAPPPPRPPSRVSPVVVTE